MKKLLALLLCILMLLPLAACSVAKNETETQTLDNNAPTQTVATPSTESGDEGNTGTEEPETEEPETEDSTVEYNHVVNDPLTWDDINAIPIANNSMSSEELRDICVDFFNLSMSFTWIPDRDYHYVVESQSYKRVLEKGKLTGGIPYITVGHGNLYRFMDNYDSETGIANMTSYMQDPKILGNACSGGASWGWARAINSVTFQWTWGMTHANGFLRVGPYEYDETLTSIGKNPGDYGAPEIIAKNGKQKMFQSYAATHKADGIVNTGHVRMVTAEPVVVYNEDGTISGDKSYLICSDQICYNTSVEKYGRVQADGTKYHIAGGCDWKYTFSELYGTNYIPFTFAEFLGTDPVEDAVATIEHTGETVSQIQLTKCTVNANYTISDVYFKLKDSEGKEVISYVRRCQSFMKKSFAMTNAIPPETVLKQYYDGKHTVELYVQLGNGTRPCIYTGTLVEN